MCTDGNACPFPAPRQFCKSVESGGRDCAQVISDTNNDDVQKMYNNMLTATNSTWAYFVAWLLLLGLLSWRVRAAARPRLSLLPKCAVAYPSCLAFVQSADAFKASRVKNVPFDNPNASTI